MTVMTAAIRAQIDAVAALLIGDGQLKEGLSICGGSPLDDKLLPMLAHGSVRAQMDTVYLSFEQTEEGAEITDIHLFAPREDLCHVYSRCEIWVSRDGKAVAILPQDHVQGRFVIDACEIVHIAGKPTDAGRGIKRAQRKLAKMAANGAAIAALQRWEIGNA